MPTTLYSPPLTPHRRAYTVTSSPVEPSLSTSSSPILRSSPLVNPAVANIVLPDIILNSPPDSRRGSATNGLLALGLGITMIPTLSHFKGKGKERGWDRDVEGRRSRSTSPKYVFSSILAPIQAATGSMGGASEKRIINIEDGQDGYDGYKTVGWKGKWRIRDEDGELTSWTVSGAMVLAMMALLCIGAMLAQSDANATNAFKDAKVIGWGDSVQGRRWGLRHAKEVLNRRQAHGDWDDSFHGFDSIHHDALYEAGRSAVSVSVKRDP